MTTTVCSQEELTAIWQSLVQEKMDYAPAVCFDDMFYQGLHCYMRMLMQWNTRMNLVGPTQWERVVSTLIIDSWYLAKELSSLALTDSSTIWDLGAGAGLPGIPLRLMWQQGVYTLVESRQKRALFLQSVLAMCSIPQTKVYRGRVEEFMAQEEPADLIVSRAFMPWQEVLALVHPKVAPTGWVAFLTLFDAPQALPVGWKVHASKPYQVEEDTRYIWIIERTSS